MSTETRSRDEWLAEVKRRGERIRRRRRLGVALVGLFAVVLPASALAGFLTAPVDDGQQLAVAGPPAPAAAAGEEPATAPEVAPEPGVTVPTAPGLVTPTTLSGLPVESIQRRTEPPARTGEGPVTEAPPVTLPPTDDPVVRATTTVAPPVAMSGGPLRLTPNQSTSSSAAAGGAAASLARCPADALQIDVVPSKATFSLGEMVTGMFFLQTGSASDCLISMPASFRIEEVATGRVLGTVGATSDIQSPLRAEPGTMPTSTFSWDQSDCSGATCAKAVPGLYQAVAVWTDGAPYRGWGEFRIGA